MYAKASSESDHSAGVQTSENGNNSNQNRTVIEFEDNRLAAIIFGQHDHNLARIEQRLGVLLINRGNRVAIEGSPEAMDLAKKVLEELYEHAKAGHDVEMGDVDGALRMIAGVDEPVKKKTPKPAAESRAHNSHLKITTRNKVIMPRSPGQADYMAKLQKNEMVFGVGPAGTGKTYLAVAMAVSRMLAGEIDRIVLSRPAVEAGENLGFLPGDLKDKVDPYLRPLYDALYDMMPAEQVEKRIASGHIEIAPLAYMRGRTLSNAFVILDEAQNTTPMQMKMFLTRFGENSRMVVCGDPSQVDLPRGTRSGLRHALDILRGVDGIAVTRFNQKDVVRHPLVARIVDAYGDDDGR
ncbi:PhoH family protein [Kordiimonas sp. SCSIO 12603]|uniref:PhoH family protein n=1 Tax=Kordiimonas sp. SCSIO 12603 TaxID=2829596 RepID=UPI002106F193|nr:PhoH family protein [Kordiimonas sp. SCSIO 12603]UTW58639.1 PhoH family protein [Kordiimonas sp. SCSIO 12603]